MSINSPLFTGTQVGIETPNRSGELVFDLTGNPIRTSDRKFFTVEDQLFTGISTGARLRIANILQPGIASEPLPEYHVVQYNDFNQLSLAVPFTQMTRPYGIIEEDAPQGDVVDFVHEGMIYNVNWDWITEGAEVNDPVYIDDTGTIQLEPYIGGQMPVGTVVGAHEILFSPKLFSQVEASVNFDISAFIAGAPTAGQFVWHNAISRNTEIAGSTSTDHVGYANTAPAGGDAEFEVLSSDSGGAKISHGTLTFQDGSNIVTSQSLTDITDLTETSALHIRCLASFGIADISITFKGHTQIFWEV